MDIPEIERVRLDVARRVKDTAGELSPVVRGQVSRINGAVSDVFDHVKLGLPAIGADHDRKRLAAGVLCGAAVVGLAVAGTAHLVYHHRAASTYRALKTADKRRQERADAIDDMLARSSCMLTADEVEEYRDGHADGAGLSQPGCYAILTYGADAVCSEPHAYRDAYVGAATDMLKGVCDQLEGRGNLYVHADRVYRQPMRCAFYPCDVYELYSYRGELARCLGADASYNRLASKFGEPSESGR